MTVSKKRITDYVSTIAHVAQTSHYQVFFSGLTGGLTNFLESKEVNNRFILEESGLRCSSASIPGSSLATASINGNYMGVQEKMVHSRIFTEMNLEFFVDRDYKIIKFFEFWMDYITNGSETGNVRKSDAGYFYRMRYPRDRDNGYKCDKIKIIKFEPSYGKELEYTFYGAFPINFSSTPVQYGSSDVLRANVTFNYERYIAGKETSIDVARQEQIESIVDDYGRTPEEARRIVNGGNEVLIGFDPS
tara:strand:- start:2112 stop:2852 length:741 start_codon:yes stop_codon:yes gene_type:complete